MPNSEKANPGLADTVFPESVHAELRQQHRENEGASVVVGGIALGTIGDGKDGVLQHSYIIGERGHMSEF